MNRAVSSSYLLVLVLFCTSSFRGQLPEGRACIFKDAKPKKAELQTLGITDDIVDYSSYSRVGTCLLNDENGNKIKKLEVDYGSVTPRIEEILRLWMNGNGATPVSWAGLVACLKPAQLNTIIERIESEYCLMGKADSHSGRHSTDEGCTKDSQTRILTGIINIMVSSYILFILIAVIIVTTVGTLFVIGCWKHFGRGKRDLHILVTGTVGAGKSALVNSIIGEYYADENDSPQKETTKVIKYEKRAGNSTISIYESPGLQLEDDNETENQYVNCVEEDCSEVDLNLYCVKMSDRIRPSAVDAVKKLCYAFGKKEFQQKTLFVLTFANDITVPNQKISSMLVQHFGDQIMRWKKLFQKALMDKAGINREAAVNVPVVPAGYYDNLLLPAAKCDNWLRKLWFHILVGLKFDNLHVENDRSWEAAMIAYLQSKGRDNLRICVIGRTGTGKSALVNSMVGNTDARAEEGDTASRVTEMVARYTRRIGDCTIFIYDSPGLHDDKEISDQYLKDIEENCGEADLNLYCIRMNNKMQPSEIDAIKKFSYAFGKNELWRKTLFVLTFANEIVLPKQKISSMLLQHFGDQMSGWKTLLEKALTEKVGISKEAAANVPVVPAGYRDKLSLPAAKCDNWLSKLRTQCFNQIKDMARPISSSINWGQLQPSEEVKKEDITKKMQPKQPNTDQGIAYEA